MPRVKANGLDIAFDSFGPLDGEAILLIAGLGVQMIRWPDAFCAALAGYGFRVIRFDNRDAGGSIHLDQYAPPDLGPLVAALMAGRRPEVPYTLHDMAADAVGLLDALAIPRAHVVGLSMGGMIAQIMASEHPGRVLSLTSIMSGTGNPALPQAEPDVLAMMMRPAPDPVLDEAGFVAHSLAFARRIAGPAHPVDDGAHRRLVLEEARRAHDPRGARRQLAAMVVAGDRRARLATIALPALVIHGACDPLIPPACGADTAASITGAEFLLVEGMGHHLPASLHRRVADAIVRLARSAGGDQAGACH
ncbi:pimeloyl-ACP methyl ester carboxylesterase [Xanthobacter flavus]|uniref:Alpha/beta hydrolase n=1 Tax=Xanthobacter flavus TaxID=281 RepID=A0A9W6FNC7_XANFL|nr:alpha/beta hydrolase [Xanthobacter flavus]MDR6335843.1 pimeloyl-ACP methyl ester carboxylesterase [Xanthobacter flavus]GLI24332.1 alpha/beta hydrolase [Xanthobacter flavus]